MNNTRKNIIVTIYLKDGKLVRSFEDFTCEGDLEERIRLYNDNGIDKIIAFDLSDGDEEHEVNLHALKEICRIAEIPVCAGGNINRLEDIKKILYAGCKKAILNTIKPVTVELAKEGAQRFGRDKLALSIFNVDLFFKQKSDIEDNISELILLDRKLAGNLADVTDMPYLVLADAIGYRAADDSSAWDTEEGYEKIAAILSSEETACGISTRSFSRPDANVEGLKKYLAGRGILTGHLRAELEWSDFRPNADGLIPVIVQDYKSDEVLMLAYMNEEAFRVTLSLGKMTYYSRSRQELWTKGVTSGHFQYVKSLMVDCDRDTILAKVSQKGAACHTGNRSCFFTDLVKGDGTYRNAANALEQEYGIIRERKLHPREGSYTNYLFDKGIDKILKKLGEEATEIVIAAKNPEPEEVKYEIADFLYHMMVLMVEKGISWTEVLEEMAQR